MVVKIDKTIDSFILRFDSKLRICNFLYCMAEDLDLEEKLALLLTKLSLLKEGLPSVQRY